MLETLDSFGFDILAKNHAIAILEQDFASEFSEVVQILGEFRIQTQELMSGGGGEAVFTQRLRHAFSGAGWKKHVFNIQTIVDGVEREGITHEIDHVKNSDRGCIALEIEWNNKDPFFDRDLENFQRLHAISVISVGVIVTRGSTLQAILPKKIQQKLESDEIKNEGNLEIYGIVERTSAQRNAVKSQTDKQIPFAEAFAKNFVQSKYGKATTHWEKLVARIERGVGNPCPLLLLGLPESIVID